MAIVDLGENVSVTVVYGDQPIIQKDVTNVVVGADRNEVLALIAALSGPFEGKSFPNRVTIVVAAEPPHVYPADADLVDANVLTVSYRIPPGAGPGHATHVAEAIGSALRKSGAEMENVSWVTP